MQKYLLTTLIGLIALFSLSFIVSAQDDEAEVIGDSDSPAVATVRSFLNTWDMNLLSEDANYSDTIWAESYQGRESINSIYQHIYNDVFTGVIVQPERYIVSADGEYVTVEYVLNGQNTGMLNNVDPTLSNANIHTAAIFHVQDGLITEIHSYTDRAAIYDQLGIEPQSYYDPLMRGDTSSNTGNMNATPVGGTLVVEGTPDMGTPVTDQETRNDQGSGDPLDDNDTDAEQTDMTDEVNEAPEPGATSDSSEVFTGETIGVDTITDNRESYYGQVVAVEDELVETWNDHVFLMQDNDLVDPEKIIVIYTGDVTGFDVVTLADEDRTVTVTGTVQQFFRSEMQSQFPDMDFTDPFFDDWEENVAIITDSVTVTETE